MLRVCSVKGCDRVHRAHGFCGMHWQRWRRHGDPLKTLYANDGEPQRFFAEKVLTCRSKDCLRWPFSCDNYGYGQIIWNGRCRKVHRLVCEQVHGKQPAPDKFACHTCGNGNQGCVNPKHLRWATKKEDLWDKLAHGTLLRGSCCPWSKLTEDQVRKIRKAPGLHKDIAKRFGVDPETVGNIKRGDTWAWLK